MKDWIDYLLGGWKLHRCRVQLGNCIADNVALQDALQQVTLVEPPKRLDFPEIDAGVVTNLYANLYGIDWVNTGMCKITGSRFKPTTIDNVMEFVRWTGVSEIPYTTTEQCGDISAALFGMVSATPGWGGTPLGYLGVTLEAGVALPIVRRNHVICTVAAYRDEPTLGHGSPLEVFYIEPQDGTLVPFSVASAWKPGLLLMV